MKHQTAAVSDYAAFLNTLPFTHYATFTTGYSMSLPSARRAMERFHDRISKTEQSYFFWVAEKFDCKDGYHTHALAQIPESLSYSNVLRIWQDVSGGSKSNKSNRINLQRYHPELGANFYIGKYIRRRDTDYDLLR